jgi:hypothetical protein
MTRAWWPLGCAAAFLLCASVGTADAQTFVVRNAPAGSAVEVSFGTAVGKSTADQMGTATVVLTGSPAATQELAAAIYTDVCGTTVRLLLAERTADPPAAGADCQRRVVPGFFVFRNGTSIVIDLAPSVPIVRIRQGRVPGSWMTEGPPPTGHTAPRGLVVFGGGGFASMPETVDQTCGNTSPCARESTKFNFMGGAAYWLTPWLGAEGTFLKASGFTTIGEGDQYQMASSVTPRVFTVAAVGALNIKAARFYGRAGGAYHRARVETTQGTFQSVISADGVTTTYPASTQVFTYETIGWGRLLGGGVEGWVSDSVAVFAEGSFMRIEGDNVDNGGERIMKDNLKSLIAGIKVHIGHRR